MSRPNEVGAASRRMVLGAFTTAWMTGCAGWSSGSPLTVSVVDLSMLPGAGVEVRIMVKLRVQNASDSSVAYDGVSLELDLRGMPFASGVSAERGNVPRFGESLISVPVTISAAALLRQLLSLARSGDQARVRVSYAARGRLAGGILGGTRFESSGDIDWPPAPAPGAVSG
jgi:LEA14-like dessication related protein